MVTATGVNVISSSVNPPLITYLLYRRLKVNINLGVISCYSCNHERKDRYDPMTDKIPDYFLGMRQEKHRRDNEQEERNGRSAMRRLDKLWETSPPFIQPSR